MVARAAHLKSDAAGGARLEKKILDLVSGVEEEANMIVSRLWSSWVEQPSLKRRARVQNPAEAPNYLASQFSDPICNEDDEQRTFRMS